MRKVILGLWFVSGCFGIWLGAGAAGAAGLQFTALSAAGLTWRLVVEKPPARFGHAMAYDGARRRVVLFGGYLGSFQGDTWEWNGSSWTEVTPAASPSPSARLRHAMAYDGARGRIVLFGGVDGESDRGDTWEWDGNSWTDVTPATSASPVARRSHAMVYDSARSRLVLFGGHAGSGFLGDTWEWDGTSWTEVTPTLGPSPSARAVNRIVYDDARGRVVLFGGQNESGFLGDTWEWDGTSWTKATPAASSSPSAREGSAVAYDSARRRVVLFGGRDDFGFLNDTWEWNGTSWTEVTPPASSPSVREGHAMTYDSARGRVVLFGGYGSGRPYPDDTHEWDGARWVDVNTDPGIRARHSMAYDSARGCVVLFGGYERVGLLRGDTWEWNGTSWTEVTPASSPSPSPREGHAMVYDSARGRVVLFGGRNDAAFLGDTWEWDGRSWTEVTPATSPSPPARDFHAMAFDSARGRVVLYGGLDGSDRGDTWEWDGASWTELTPAASPSPSGREHHAMVYDSARGRILLFGGYGGGIQGDTWEWDGTSWSEVTPVASPSPSARYLHAMAYDSARGRVVLFGGWDLASHQRGDTWEWDGTSWTDVSSAFSHSPEPRAEHAMVYDSARSRVVLFGGRDSLFYTRSDTWEYGTCIVDPDCDDDNPCTDDTCEDAGTPAAICARANNTSSCSDFDACTTDDVCSGGTCVGGLPPNCDDGKACTTDECRPFDGCFSSPLPYGTACSDGNPCTSSDTCDGDETCVGGSAIACADDGNTCTANVCDPAAGCVSVDVNLFSSDFSANRVDGRDLAVLADAWNSCPDLPRYDARANLDPQDACVGDDDFHQFMLAFGHSCG